MMYDTSDFRNGLKVEMDGNPYVMVYFQFVKPGKGTAFTRTKLKNMRPGAVIERTFRTGREAAGRRRRRGQRELPLRGRHVRVLHEPADRSSRSRSRSSGSRKRSNT
jgi:hypothetical protein